MRIVEPLGPEDWNSLVEDLERGQTELQRKIMDEARELYGTPD